MICEVLPKTLPCILAGRSPPATNALTRTPPSNGELFPPCSTQPAWAFHLRQGTFVFCFAQAVCWMRDSQTASSSIIVPGSAWGAWRIVTHAVGVVGGRAAVRVSLDRRRVLRPPVHRPAIVLCTTSPLVRESHKQRKLRSAKLLLVDIKECFQNQEMSMLVVGAHAREDEECVLPHPLPLLERGGNVADLRQPPRPRLATRVHPHHRKSFARP